MLGGVSAIVMVTVLVTCWGMVTVAVLSGGGNGGFRERGDV